MPEALLTMHGVSASYGQGLAVERLDLVVARAATTVVLGANGAGKSTTLKLMAGLLPAVDGSLTAEGGLPIRVRRGGVIRPGVAMSPEGRRLFAQMSVEENLLIGATRIPNPRPAEEKLAEIYDLFPRVAERRKQMAGTLSGGEQQMVAIGRALMARPRLICMDEPSMGLSPAFVDQVFEIIQTINKQGITIFVVEQNAAMALSIADRGYVLQTGEVVLSGTAKSLLENEMVQKAYLGQMEA